MGLLSQYLLGHLKIIAEIPLVGIVHALRASILKQKPKTVKIKNSVFLYQQQLLVQFPYFI